MYQEIKSILRPFYQGMLKIVFGYRNSKFLKSSESYLRSLKDIHLGKRCFIIGNGPSLLSTDLDKLKSEICFAANAIYLIYDETSWRPTYYCSQDERFIDSAKDVLNKEISLEAKFIGVFDYKNNPLIHNAIYMKKLSGGYNFHNFPQNPKFSEDISKGYFSSSTVTYTSLQLAVYMGFKTIYLLGVDHNYSITKMPDGSVKKDSSIKDHFSENDKLANIPQLYNSALAYETAKEYADSHGIKIYNATRGGKLEVFERVDFDSLFQKERDLKNENSSFCPN